MKKRQSNFKRVSEFGLTMRNQNLINSLYNHPFKALLTNLTEVNLGYSIKKLNKEEIIQIIEGFFEKIRKYYFFLFCI